MKSKEQSVRAASPENLLGELSALLRQIGSPEFSPNSTAPFWAAAVDDLPALNHFLEDYLNRILLPCELPAILEACEHARRGEWRELLAQAVDAVIIELLLVERVGA